MYRKLNPEEQYVILHKGTEAPFSGEFENFSKQEFIIANNAIKHYTILQANFIVVVAGLVLMTA